MESLSLSSSTSKSIVGYSNGTFGESHDHGEDDGFVENDPDAYFVAIFNDGTTFKNLIDYIRGMSKIGYFTLTKNKITHVQSDDYNIWINDVTINVSDLPEYEFSSCYSKIVIGLELDRLKEHMKIGKKDGIRLYKLPRDDHIYVQDLISGSTENRGVSFLLPVGLGEMKSYSDYKYDDKDEDSPNCVVVANDLCRDFTQMYATKNNKAIFKGYTNGMTITLDSLDGGGRFKQYGNINEAPQTNKLPLLTDATIVVPKEKPKIIICNPDEISTVVVGIELIKLWIKLKNLADTATVRFFFKRNKPMKIVSKIGYFGTLRIYVKNNNIR